MPGDLSPVDAFTWEMQNRIGTKIYFDYDEIEMIRDYPQLMTSIRNFVQQYNRKPDGSDVFKLSEVDRQRYPKFASLVDNNIRDYVMSNSRILDALKKFSGLSEQKIRTLLTSGYGPMLVIKQITDPNFFGQPGYVYGEFDKQIPNEISIDQTTVQYYENESSWPEVEKAWMTLLAQTLIHEFSHYGALQSQIIDYTDGQASAGGGKYEHKFDIAAFGYANNAGNVIDYVVLRKL